MPNKMFIIGIDPGYDRLGIAVIEKRPRQKEIVVFSECFSTDAKKTIYERLNLVGDEVARVLDLYKPQKMAIENLFITKNQKTAMRVAEARGIILYEAAKRSIEINEFTPMEIKVALTGDGTSDKTRIMKMVHLLVNIPERKMLDDEYDAIAIALTGSATSLR